MELLKASNKKDTLLFSILRENRPITIKLTVKDILPIASRAAWSDIEDATIIFEVSLYKPENFNQFFIGGKIWLLKKMNSLVLN